METLINRHKRLISQVKTNLVRSYIDKIDWDTKLIAIRGARGVGKTTLLLQYIKLNYGNDTKRCLYASLDSLYFSQHSLSECVEKFYQNGGEHLFLDEVHKYPSWSVEIKNIYDEYPDLKIVFTGSSLINILNAEADLSRRCIAYDMQGLSYREFLSLYKKIDLPSYSLNEILRNADDICNKVNGKTRPLQYFDEYLRYGYYPFYLEKTQDYYTRIENVTNMILDIELPQLCGVDVGNIRKIKALLQVMASGFPMMVDITRLGTLSGLSRTTILSYLQYLDRAKLISLLYSDETSVKKMQKPDKILMENANLLYAISSETVNIGTARETYFCNQLRNSHTVEYAPKGDFRIDGKYTFEIGGKSKDGKLIANIENAYIAAADTEYTNGNKLPIWLFGMMY